MTPSTVPHQTPLSMGFSRQESWSGLPFPSPGDLTDSGIESASPALQADFFTTEPLGTSSHGVVVFPPNTLTSVGPGAAIVTVERGAGNRAVDAGNDAVACPLSCQTGVSSVISGPPAWISQGQKELLHCRRTCQGVRMGKCQSILRLPSRLFCK